MSLVNWDQIVVCIFKHTLTRGVWGHAHAGNLQTSETASEIIILLEIQICR